MTRTIGFILAALGAATIVPSSALAMPNPASVFCEKMGGRSVMAKLESGDELGLCYLPKNRIVEEWTLYRMFKGKKPPRSKNPFS